METTETAEAVATPMPGMEKRKYTKVDKGEFIKLANKLGTIRGVVDATGMSYSGVFLKLKSLRAAKCALKSSLFERQKPTRKEKAQEEEQA